MKPEERPRVDRYVEDRLIDWGRWARSGKWQSSCGSAEKYYLPEAGEIWQDEPRPVPVDQRDAWQVECLWRTKLEYRDRVLLRAHYVLGAGKSPGRWFVHIRRTSRHAGIRADQWGHAVGSAARKLGEYLVAEYQGLVI